MPEPTVEIIKPPCVLPHADVQKFLLEVIAQAQFPGAISEFVSGVKAAIRDADIANINTKPGAGINKK